METELEGYVRLGKLLEARLIHKINLLYYTNQLPITKVAQLCKISPYRAQLHLFSTKENYYLASIAL